MMGLSPAVFFLSLAITTTLSLIINDTTPNQSTHLYTDSDLSNKTNRKGKFIHVDVIEIPGPVPKLKRHVIKLPPNVSKVKLVRPIINVKQTTRSTQPLQIKRIFRGPRRPEMKKQDDYEFELENPQFYKGKMKNNLRIPEEFYQEVEMNQEESMHQQSKKKNARHVLGEYLANFEVENRPLRHNHEEEEYNKARHRYILKGSEGMQQPMCSHHPAASTIHMKQVPPPNLYALKLVNSPETEKHSFGVEKPILGSFQDDNYIPGLNIKKLPMKGRQVQSLFSQQYTSHNPHVTTNFGLSGYGGIKGFPYIQRSSFGDATPTGLQSTLGKFRPTVAASEQVVTALPLLGPGIQVIQPPQFTDVIVSHPSNPTRFVNLSPQQQQQQQQQETSSQRATIRDILDQDCPSYDIKGYCESPPRYPMQQITNIVKKCANLMEMMNTQPFDEPHDVYNFGKRSDQMINDGNNTQSDDSENNSWSRSSNEGSTACTSDVTLTEPGYAKEVISERWFVIVQNPDTIIQRIATDTCRNPGKPCGGLSAVKCAKVNGMSNKSTMCIQRYTYQRLVSWDPESPEGCPRIRLFRFPSACICHLGVV